jgi:RNA polymerase sigma-70 factor (ECF subfamily)
MTDPATPSFEHLITLARTQDSQALGVLLELYRPYLVLMARLQLSRRLQGKFDAADVVQEAFLAAHRSFARFRGTTEAELAAWLRQILASRIAKSVRHYWGTKGRDVRLECALVDDMDRSSQALSQALAAPCSTPSHQAARREQAVLLADALAALPDGYREVLILRHLEGLTFPEVARRLGRTLDSVEKVWVRALGKLRHSLGVRP